MVKLVSVNKYLKERKCFHLHGSAIDFDEPGTRAAKLSKTGWKKSGILRPGQNAFLMSSIYATLVVVIFVCASSSDCVYIKTFSFTVFKVFTCDCLSCTQAVHLLQSSLAIQHIFLNTKC